MRFTSLPGGAYLTFNLVYQLCAIILVNKCTVGDSELGSLIHYHGRTLRDTHTKCMLYTGCLNKKSTLLNSLPNKNKLFWEIFICMAEGLILSYDTKKI